MSTGDENKTLAEHTLSLVRTDLYALLKTAQNGLDQLNPSRLRFNEPTSDSFYSSLEYRDRLIVRRSQLDLVIRGIEVGCHWVARYFYESEVETLQATLTDYVEEEVAKRRLRIEQMQHFIAALQ